LFQVYTYVPLFPVYAYVPIFQAYTYVPMACAVSNTNDYIATNTPCSRATSPHVVGLLGYI